MSGLRTWFGRGLDQDWVDWANGFWSVLLLAVLSAGAFLARYVTDPINCWTPAQFTGAINDYTKHACFMKDQYYLPLGKVIPVDRQWQLPVKSYHLWIPLILFFQALCFKIPNIIWNTGKHYLTLNLDETVDTLKQAMVNGGGIRKSVFQDTAKVLGKLLERNKFLLVILYLFVKLLFLLNLLGQFIFLTLHFRNYLVAKTETYLGMNITNVVKPLFHKVIMCDLDVRFRGNVHVHSLQCALPITEIYEKLFVFLWYWIFLLAVVTIFNLLLWAGFLFLPFLRDSRITAYIKACPGSPHDSSIITRFISGFLGIDGVLVLSMISQNSSEMVAANLSQQLYQVFLEKGTGHQPGPSTSTGGPIYPSVPPSTDVPMTNPGYSGAYAEKPPAT